VLNPATTRDFFVLCSEHRIVLIIVGPALGPGVAGIEVQTYPRSLFHQYVVHTACGQGDFRYIEYLNLGVICKLAGLEI